MKYRELHINIRVRLVEAFLVNLVGNMIYPFMAIYFAEKLGAAITGYLMILYILIGLGSGLYGGTLTDRYGRRRMLRWAETGRVLSLATMAFANSPWFDSPVVTLVSMLALNGFGGLAFPAMQAMIVDCTTPENRKFVYSFDYWALNTSLLVGGMVGAFFFRDYLFELMSAAALVSFGSLMLLLFVIQETHHPAPSQGGQQTSAPKSGSGYGKVFRDSTFMIYILACALLISMENIFFNYSGIRLSNEFSHWTPFAWMNLNWHVDGVGMFGVLRTENALLVVLLSVVAVRVFSRFRDLGVLMTGILLTLAGFAILAVTNNPWLLVICMLVATGGELLHTSIRQSYLAEMIPAANRGTYMALTGLIGVTSQMIGAGSITIGAYVPSWTIGVVTVLIGVSCAALFLVTIKRLPERKRNMQAEAVGQEAASI
ncbi:MFS transporter [Tumebacillus flagellatus]|uniref:Major facilitator superfamily (MFS) profile domain-containing protein n=1 Tax=Tumebacillus flagellatus TaxID=1157490 RepID=A0A074MDW0_9BACL|nr:MFS transporter [Tumebacillus flagellatus]KEO84022.1 hypothetical protein EL26_07510 [Tumebacillus flagellatus]